MTIIIIIYWLCWIYFNGWSRQGCGRDMREWNQWQGSSHQEERGNFFSKARWNSKAKHAENLGASSGVRRIAGMQDPNGKLLRYTHTPHVSCCVRMKEITAWHCSLGFDIYYLIYYRSTVRYRYFDPYFTDTLEQEKISQIHTISPTVREICWNSKWKNNYFPSLSLCHIHTSTNTQKICRMVQTLVDRIRI